MENEIQTTVECTLCGAPARFAFAKAGYKLFRCPNCALLFVHPIPKVSEVYGQDYFEGAHGGHGYTNYDRDKEPMVPVFEEYVRRISALLPTKGRLLDVGAATGFFVAIANLMGFTATGVELSSYAAAVGRQKGLEIVAGTLSDISGAFEVITMLDVIEHVPDPRAELTRAHALLVDGGVLVLNTPDIGSLYARLMGKRWHLVVPPEHLFYFTRRNLSMLLVECGFEVVEVTTIGKSFTLPYIFKTLYAWQGLALWGWLERLTSQGFLSRIALPINTRDNMFLIAKKR